MPVEAGKPKIKQDITMAQLLAIQNFLQDIKIYKKNRLFRSVLVLCSTKVLEFFVLANVNASPEDG